MRCDEQKGVDPGPHALKAVPAAGARSQLVGPEEDGAATDQRDSPDATGDQIRQLLRHEGIPGDAQVADEDDQRADTGNQPARIRAYGSADPPPEQPGIGKLSVPR